MSNAASHDYFGTAGTRMSRRFFDHHAAFGALVEHPRVMAMMRDIDGTEFLFSGSGSAWSNFDDTPWHTDGVPGKEVPSAKIAVYLDAMDETSGALQVIPGSNHPQFCAALFQASGVWDDGRPRLQMPPDEVPGAVAIRTALGDVVLWDNRLWHYAPRRHDGLPRRALFIQYYRDPGDDMVAREVLRRLYRAVLGDQHVYPWSLLQHPTPAREHMATRLEALGIENVREAPEVIHA
jgi:ectoine hydroxylase-related dioxygenase (phytanoyl-CoA dioxygenase family)